MTSTHETSYHEYIVEGDHSKSDYFTPIKRIAEKKMPHSTADDETLETLYGMLLDEITTNTNDPGQTISFGTSGWRGILGKDIYVRSVAQVTQAIVEMYEGLSVDSGLSALLGVDSLDEARTRGCVLGFDNRFAGEVLAGVVASVLTGAGFKVFYAGESTTGALSAAVLINKSAFSINLTPSHNPLEYGGYKFNAADGGPAAGEVTGKITENARRIVANESGVKSLCTPKLQPISSLVGIQEIDALSNWQELVTKNADVHGVHLDTILASFQSEKDLKVVVDCVHGASRLHIKRLLDASDGAPLELLRDNADVTFGGVAPEPSTKNMERVVETLAQSDKKLKLGAIIDPDGDRIRFTDGTTEISMNQFGAMAYHYLHEYKNKNGIVAKTVATSNLANSIANNLGEDIFEPSVGFKNFKPVIGKAVVFFEESDGISILGHTPEKDAYIGLLLALDMILTTGINLGSYLKKIEETFGAYYPDRDGVEVSVKGEELLSMLSQLEKYTAGSVVKVGGEEKKIIEVISIDGRKMILEDGSWLMIRPSGTEPKVRFYVESRTRQGTAGLVETAREMLQEIGVLSS
ncbi:phosphohexomutase domain-containing protein [Desulforhopalus sp. 52FAK]